MMIQWLGHSCFKISEQEESIVIDPYKDGMVPGLSPLRVSANQVLCSHEHEDHNYRCAVTLLPPIIPSHFTITTIPTYHDSVYGKKRGENTIHLIQTDSLKIAHLGDLGCELVSDQIEQLQGLDALMIPIGGTYTIDSNQAKALIHLLQPRVIIPMHYRSNRFGFDVLERIEPFLSSFDPSKIYHYEKDYMTLTPKSVEQVVVLRYLG